MSKRDLPLRYFVGQALLVPNGVITTSHPGCFDTLPLFENSATAFFASEKRFLVRSERDTNSDD